MKALERDDSLTSSELVLVGDKSVVIRFSSEARRPLSYASCPKEQKALPAPTGCRGREGPTRYISLVLEEVSQSANPGKTTFCLCGRVKPAFGWPQDVPPSCCSKCKTEGMLRLRGCKCRCGAARPTFGMVGDARPACLQEVQRGRHGGPQKSKVPVWQSSAQFWFCRGKAALAMQGVQRRRHG